MVHAFTQRHFVPVMAPAAILRGVGRVDCDKRSASFFRFARQLVNKPCPRGVVDALSQTMIVNHAVNLQVFHADHAKTVNDLTAFLMREVIPSERYPFMHPGYHLAMLPALRRSLCQFGVRALHLRQCLLFFTEKAWILNCISIRQRSEGLQSHIYTHLSRGFWQTLRLTLHREGHVPFARRRALDGTRFDRALDGTMRDHLDTPNLGKRHTIIMRDAEPTLRESEAVIAVFAPKAREARLLTGFAASEKGFEGQINAHGNVLQHLRMHLFQWRTFLFQHSQRINLIIARERLSLLLIGLFALLKQMVVEPPTRIKGVVQRVNLFLRGKNAILKHFVHRQMVVQTGAGKSSGKPLHPPLPQARNACASPASKTGVFKRS